MDILSSKGFPEEWINDRISKSEAIYPSLKEENDMMRKLHKFVPHVDLNAALLSDCRSDAYTCGRCKFFTEYKRHISENSDADHLPN